MLRAYQQTYNQQGYNQEYQKPQNTYVKPQQKQFNYGYQQQPQQQQPQMQFQVQQGGFFQPNYQPQPGMNMYQKPFIQQPTFGFQQQQTMMSNPYGNPYVQQSFQVMPNMYNQ